MPEDQLPIEYEPATGVSLTPLSLPVDNGPNPIAAKLFGIGRERYQTWPERLVRSAFTLPGEVMSGKLPIVDPETGRTNEKVIKRAQDLAGMAGGGLLLEKPGVATLGSGAVRQAPKAELEAKIIQEYNKRLPSVKDQYYDWAGEDYNHRIIGKKEIDETYGDKSDWPNEIKNLMKTDNDQIVEISSPSDVEWFSKEKAPSLDDHVEDIVSKKGGLFSVNSLDGIMDNLNKKTLGSESAASDAFKIMAAETGWDVSNGVRYFTITKGDKNLNIRISDHANLTRTNPNAVTPDINIAPGAHDFNDALRILQSKNNTLYSDSGEVGKGIAAVKNSQKSPAFYSGLEKAVETAKPTIATADQWLGYLKNQPGVKSEELATVLKELPSGPITKEALRDIVKANKVELGEVYKGNLNNDLAENIRRSLGEKLLDNLNTPADIVEAKKYNTHFRESVKGKTDEEILKAADEAKAFKGYGETKFHQYQLPGGEPGSYKEMLLTLPETKIEPKQYTIKKEGEHFRVYPEDRNTWESQHPSEAAAQKSIEANQFRAQMAASSKNDFKSSHWDEPNVLAHIRMNDRNVEGSKTLHLEEIQSDWGQKIRREGYKLDPKEKEILDNNAKSVDDKLIAANRDDIMGNPDLKVGLGQAVKDKIINQKEADDYLKLTQNENSTTPNMPFKKNWDELALKKMIHKAASEGYEGISWTPGEAQAARYDLSKQIKGIHWRPSPADKNATLVQLNPTAGDNLKLQVDKSGKIVAGFPSSRVDQWEGKNLADVIGKEHAEKILNKADGSLEGEGLKIGGEGMKSFYDKMLVDKANALAKKYGSKVEQKEIPIDAGKPTQYKNFEDWQKAKAEGRTQPIHYLPLTPELKKKALQDGFPLFSSSPILNPVDFDPFKNEKKKFKLVPVQGNPFQ